MKEAMTIEEMVKLVKRMYMLVSDEKEMDAVDKYCEYLVYVVDDDNVEDLIDVISKSQEVAKETLMIEPYDRLSQVN